VHDETSIPTDDDGGPIERNGRTIGPWSAMVLVVAGAAVPLAAFRNWFVNHDGGFYMALARNLAHGNGYTFPDGTVATFRGPVFAGLIASAWTVLPDTSSVAIWSTRVVFIAIPVLVALILRRLVGRWPVAVVGGVIASVQPIALASGTLWFVPDGLVAALVLAAILVVVWNAPALPGRIALLATGVVFGVAFMAKDTAILGMLIPIGWIASAPIGGTRRAIDAALIMVGGVVLTVAPWVVYTSVTVGRLPDGLGGVPPLVGLVAAVASWSLTALGWLDYRRRETRSWVSSPWLTVAATAAVALAALVVLGPPLAFPVRRISWAVARLLDGSLYRDSPWILIVPAILIAVVYALRYMREAGVFLASLVVAVGVSSVAYTALADLGVRNGILMWFGFSMLVAIALSDLWTRYERTLPKVAVVFVAVAAIVGSFSAAESLNARTDPRIQSDEAPATVAAAAWLQENVGEAPIIGTPRLIQTMWVLADGEEMLNLVPVHTMSRSAWLDGERTFEQVTAWAGVVDAPETRGVAQFYQVTPNTTAAFFLDAIQESVRETSSRYLIVTGNWEQPRSALDAGGLLPLLESAAFVSPVFRSDPDQGPQWVVIYRVDGEIVSDEPVIVHPSVGGPVPTLGTDQIVLNADEYVEMVREILSLPVGPKG